VRGVQLLFLMLGAALATIAPFVSVMLRARGLEPAAVGLVGSVSALGFTLAVPVWGHLADMSLGRVRALQLAAVGAGVSLILFDLPLPAFVLGAMVVGFNVFQSALGPLADALAVGVLADRPHEYGRIRLLSSLSYGVVVILVGLVYDRTGYGPVPFVWLASCALLVAGLFVVREPKRRPAAATHRRGGSARLALQVQPRLPVVLFAFGLLFFAVLGAFTFLNLRLVELGGGPSDIALAGGLSAIAEIPGMIVAARIARRIGLRGLFVLSAVGYSACILSWALIDTPALIIASRAASGPAFAGLWVACVLTINVLLPQGLQATGQALYQTTAFGIGAMIANALGGVVYEELGPPTLFAIASAVAIVAAVVGWAVLPRSGDLRRAEPTAAVVST
jgi:PPP family 3-phenylpropionic acid transporter